MHPGPLSCWSAEGEEGHAEKRPIYQPQSWKHTHTHTYSEHGWDTHTHTHTQSLSHTLTHTHIHQLRTWVRHTHTHTHSLTQSPSHSLTHTPTQNMGETHTHTHTHTYSEHEWDTHTHTHTPTQNRGETHTHSSADGARETRYQGGTSHPLVSLDASRRSSILVGLVYLRDCSGTGDLPDWPVECPRFELHEGNVRSLV